MKTHAFRASVVGPTGNPLVGSFIHPFQQDDETVCQAVGSGARVLPGHAVSPKPVRKAWTLIQVEHEGRKYVARDGYFHDTDEEVTIQLHSDGTLSVRKAGDPVSTGPRVMVLFGDSDTSNPGPAVRKTSLDQELADFPDLTVINRAQGNLPIGTSAEPDGGGPKRSGLDVIRQACEEIERIDIAVIRNGLNDAHYYLTPPTPHGIAKFRYAYEKGIDALQAKGALVMVCEIALEGGRRNRDADVAINDAIRDLAAKKGCILISPGIDALADPEQYISDADQVHLTNAGTRYVARLIREAIPL